MIEGLKPYAKYKESGLPWLGKVPSHWRDWRLDRLFELRRETPLPEDQRVTGYLSGRVTLRTNVQGLKIKGVIKDGNWQRVHPGDFAISGMNAHLGGMGVSDSLGKCSPIYLVLKPKPETNAHFVSHVVRHIAHTGALKSFVNTIRFNSADFKRDALKLFRILLPVKEEQSSIVAFIDQANVRIERGIQAKKKLIALLNEQKEAIIHRAVTRGLDPTVPLKPSGIPWLSESPSKWSWIPIKRLLSHMDYGTSEASKEDGRIRVLTMRNIQKGEVIVPRSGGLDEVPDFLFLEHNDLLFTRTNGNPDLVGKVGIFRGQLSDKVSFASYLVRLRAKHPHDPQWLHMLLNSAAFWPFARSHALVNLQTNLNSTRYGQFAVPVPPTDEQARIVRWVGEESKSLIATMERTEQEIRLLREYRTRLVADVVTGKGDVREAARQFLTTQEELPVVVNDEELEEEADA